MSFIVTADLQAEFSNLDLCSQAWNEILSICSEKKISTIVVAGDLKHSYNPCDIRVIKWWQHAISKAKKDKREVVCVLGNHDRVGAYSSADNWFSILRKAGAVTYDTPAIHQLEDMRLFILPYDSVSNTKHNAKKLLKHKPDKHKDVLIFHANLLEARYSQHGQDSRSSLGIDDLECNHYKYAIGGDIHLPQKIENVYYVGSPFCQDWGEVNQLKRYLVVRSNGKLESIASKLPRWYDPVVSGFEQSLPKVWTGAKVRITVSCNAGEDYGRRLDKARRRAEKKYKGAYIYVAPKFITETLLADAGSIKSTDSDEHKIREYARQSVQQSEVDTKVAVKYMLKVLAHSTQGMRQQLGIEFEYAKARNFLSYEKLYLDFRKRGIVLIQGINKDRGGKSNGSGKSSLVQPIPVSLFGKTFKGQKADSWRNRWTTGNAYVEVVCRSDRKRIKIRRERKPTALRMEINGHAVNSGMRTTDRDGTQGQIEQQLGFTWHTLANAVYIDRSIADAFVSGTKAERTALLSRFQNLERFDQALKYVRSDIGILDKKKQDLKLLLERIRTSIEQLTSSIKDVKILQAAQGKQTYRALHKAEKSKQSWHRRNKSVFKKLHSKEKKYKHSYELLQQKYLKIQSSVAISQREFEAATKTSGSWLRVSKKKKCPTCFQSVRKDWVKQHSKELQRDFDSKRKTWDELSAKSTRYKKQMTLAEADFDSIQVKLTKLEREGSEYDIGIQQLKKQYKQMTEGKGEAEWILVKSKRKLEELQDSKLVLKEKLRSYRKRMGTMHYAQEAFSRDGIPAFLNRQLCPVLNKAADYYAELFSDREIQVQFVVEKGEFIPKIINPRGGENIDDQSTGERALAGLIASFALREVAPKCNLLVLDEPAEGLDEQTAKQFARSLQTLKSRFGTIFVCTHNAHILGELSHEHTITVRKKNKISRVEEKQ